MAHRRSVLLVALVSLLATPELASAGTVSVQDGRLVFATCDASGLEAAAAQLGDGADTIDATGLTVPVTVTGGSGDDTLTGGLATDVLGGGEGIDTADSSDRDEGVCVTLNGPSVSGGHDEVDEIGEDVERVLFGDGPDVITTGRWEHPIEVHGGKGDDYLSLGGGHHRIYAGRSRPGGPTRRAARPRGSCSTTRSASSGTRCRRNGARRRRTGGRSRCAAAAGRWRSRARRPAPCRRG